MRENQRVRLMARPMLSPVAMKDLVLIGVSLAFFVVAWIYTKSLDRL